MGKPRLVIYLDTHVYNIPHLERKIQQTYQCSEKLVTLSEKCAGSKFYIAIISELLLQCIFYSGQESAKVLAFLLLLFGVGHFTQNYLATILFVEQPWLHQVC